GQAVHGVGGEHAGAGATGGAGAALVFFDHLVGGGRIGRNHHGIDQVQLVFRQLGFTGFHGAAGHKDGRNVQAQGGHQHARGDFVAVGDAHQRIGTVGIGHVLYGVGNDLPGGQGVQHAVVAHGDTVVHGDGVELLGHTTGGFDFATDQLAQVLQVHVAGHKLGERVGNGDNRFAEIVIFHTGGAPERTGASHVAAGS